MNKELGGCPHFPMVCPPGTCPSEPGAVAYRRLAASKLASTAPSAQDLAAWIATGDTSEPAGNLIVELSLAELARLLCGAQPEPAQPVEFARSTKKRESAGKSK